MPCGLSCGTPRSRWAISCGQAARKKGKRTTVEMTFNVELTPAHGLVAPHFDLLGTAQRVLDCLEHDGEQWIFRGSDTEVGALVRAMAASYVGCREFLETSLATPAPQSSVDVILELTHRMAALSELVAVNHRARRVAEKALAEVWKLAGASVADIDKAIAAKSADQSRAA